MSLRFVIFVALVVVALAALAALGQPPIEHVPPAPPAADVMVEARDFFRHGAAAMQTAKQSFAAIERGIYWAGVKDGAVGAVIVTLIGYFVLLRKPTA